MRTRSLVGPRGVRLIAELPVFRRERARGLRGRMSLGPSRAMLFERCRSVHTFGMGFPIKVAGLDRWLGVRWIATVRPRRIVPPRRHVRHVLELDPAVDVRVGDRLRAGS
jgi:uncharacterized protein